MLLLWLGGHLPLTASKNSVARAIAEHVLGEGGVLQQAQTGAMLAQPLEACVIYK